MVRTLEDHLASPVEPWRLDLIADHLASALRYAATLQRRFPAHDVEPAVCHALYLAALTYRPGRQGFFRWMQSKIHGSTANFRRADRRRAVAGITVTSRPSFDDLPW